MSVVPPQLFSVFVGVDVELEVDPVPVTLAELADRTARLGGEARSDGGLFGLEVWAENERGHMRRLEATWPNRNEGEAVVAAGLWRNLLELARARFGARFRHGPHELRTRPLWAMVPSSSDELAPVMPQLIGWEGDASVRREDGTTRTGKCQGFQTEEWLLLSFVDSIPSALEVQLPFTDEPPEPGQTEPIARMATKKKKAPPSAAE